MAFSFWVHLFFLEICTFLYYANEESYDVIGGSTKTVQHSIKNISRNIGAVFFKLGIRSVHHERESMTPTVLLSWQHSWLQSLSVKTNKYAHLQSFKVGQRVKLGTQLIPILPELSPIDCCERTILV